MGRMAGLRSAMKKQRKKMAQRMGVAISRVSPRRTLDTLGLRREASLQMGNPKKQAKPGFAVKIRPISSFDRRGNELVAADVEKGIKLMRKYDPKLEQIPRRKK